MIVAFETRIIFLLIKGFCDKLGTQIYLVIPNFQAFT